VVGCVIVDLRLAGASDGAAWEFRGKVRLVAIRDAAYHQLLAMPIQDVIQLLDDDSLEELKRERELGELNFASVVEKLRVIRRFLEAFGQDPPDELPSDLPPQVESQSSQIEALVQSMKEFTLAQDQAQSQRNSIEAGVETVRQWLSANVRPHLRGSVVDLTAKSADITTAAERARVAAEDAEKLLNRVRQVAGEAGATQMSSYYERQARDHSERARSFLLATAGALAVTIGLGIYVFVFEPIPLDIQAAGSQWEEFIRGLVVRVFFLGVAGYLLAFTARNYRISKHLQIANEEKRNALNTFILFRESVPEPEAQSIITAELVRAVFGPTATGFLSAEQEKTIIESQPSVLGALRGASPG
jgi:hypothetical protein